MGDPSYEAGYRAGHLQGWLDAMARLQGPTTTAGGSAPRPAPSVPASEVPISMAPASTFAAVSPLPPVTAPAAPARVVIPAPPVPQPRPRPRTSEVQTFPETPAERQARRDKRDRQNINITLYVASLLLVAAAALFIGTSLPPVLRFAGVCVVTALFYSAGIVLHARVPRLRPAAVAFAGTGLAMVPVTGLALYIFALPDGPAAWLITSLIGTGGYVAAAVRLESRVLVYLSLTFVASTAFSGVSVLGGALVWYFAALIGVAVLLTALALLRPGWLPPVYVRPLMVLHPFVVPAVAVAATFVPLLLDKAEYALVMGMCGVYFALMSSLPLKPAVPGRRRLLNFYGARASLTVAAAVGVWHLTGRGSDALLTVVVLFAAQATGIALLAVRLEAWFPALTRSPASAVGLRRDAMRTGTAGVDRWLVDARVMFALLLAATAAFGVQGVAAGYFHGLATTGYVAMEGLVPLWVPVALSLATGMLLAARWTGRAEGAPAAALLLAAIAAPWMGAWPLASLLLLAALFWGLRGVPAEGTFRGRLVLAARVAFTLAVPVTAAAVVDDGPGRVETAVFSLLAALVCQQLLTAVLERFGSGTWAAQATLGAFAAAGVGALLCLTLVDTSPGNSVTAVALLIQLSAALAAGALMAPRPGHERDWVATVWEAVPLGMSVLAAAVAFQVVSQGAGNLALVLAIAYLLATAVRLRLRQHRWVYWWMSRAAATVLTMTAFHQLRQEGGVLVVADEVLRPATVLVTVLALQLCLPLIAAARRRAPRWILADPGAVLLLQLGACAALAQSGSVDRQWTWAIGAVAVGAAASGYCLRGHAGSLWLAPGALVSLLALTGGRLGEIELLLGVFAAYSAVMVVAEPQHSRKGWYFVAARVLTAALALVLSYDITASPTVVSVTFAVVLAAQHLVRWVMRSRLAEVPFQQAAVWITLAGQALLPLAYLAQAGGAGPLGADDDGGRWVVLLELVMLLVSAVVARRFFGARGSLYFAVYAVLSGVLALGPLIPSGLGTSAGTFLGSPVLTHTGTAVVLLLLAVLAAGARVVWRGYIVGREDSEHWLWLVAAVGSAVTGLLVSPLASDWVTGAAMLVLAGVGFTASHVEHHPMLYPLAACAAVIGGLIIAEPAYADVPGAWGGFLPWLTGAGAASAALYLVRLYRGDSLLGDPVRRWSLSGAAFLGLMLVALAGTRHDATAWTAAAVLASAVGLAYLEAPAGVRRVVLEAGALVVTMAVQRAALFGLDGRGGNYGGLSATFPDLFWVVQWYVVLAAGLGGLRYLSRSQSAGRFLVGVSAVLLSLGGLAVVFGGSGGKQLWVLVLLALLLLAGLGLGERIFVGWGAAGVAVCILWAMRNYTFLLLAVIAAGLIAFAVWRLNRGASGNAPDAPDVLPDGPGVVPDGQPDRTAEPSRTEHGKHPAGPDTVAGTERSTSWNG